MNMKLAAIAIYAALIAVEHAAKELPDSPEKVVLAGKIAELHNALNDLRKLTGMSWEEFADFIEIEQPELFSGGTNKDPPPPPGGEG